MTNKDRREFVKTAGRFGALALAGSAILSPLSAQGAQNTQGAQGRNEQDLIKNAISNGERIPAKGFGVESSKSKFKSMTFSRHPMGANDIVIEILFSGICHSDIHYVKDEWEGTTYPLVPGHEIAGCVIAVGKNVKKFKVGDYAGVGCMVNSCGECEACKSGHEQFCDNKKTVFTYNSKDFFHNDEITRGGYSSNIVVSEKFAVTVPKDAPLDKVAPLLCAGITTYSPLKFSKVKKGSKVAVAGFGGLGSMAVKYAVQMGAEVSVFARNNKKEKEALAMGAKKLYTTTDPNEVKERFDLIISTIPTKYDLAQYVELLKYGGELAIVGRPPQDSMPTLNTDTFIFKAGKKVYGSLIGGMKETQEMLDFSLKHKIYPETEIITADKIDEAYKNLTTGKAKFRYVIDMKKSFA